MRLSIKPTSTPKYVRVAEVLREQIHRDFTPGSRFPTLSELRESHGVSISTMERVYAVLEQEGLLVREHGRGTFVKAPPSKPRYVIAVSPRLMPEQQNPYWFNLLTGINAAATDERIEILFSTPNYNSIWERADGMIVSGEPLTEFGKAPAKFPFVSLISTVEGADCVAADDYSGVYQLTEHLIGLGHQRIALLDAWGEGNPLINARHQGYHDALQDHGIPFEADLIRFKLTRKNAIANYSPYVEAGYEGTKAWLQEDWGSLGCTAIMAYNDSMAIGIMQALREAGLQVPTDVSVTGFDGGSSYDYLHQKLTTIHVPLEEIGRVGLKTLIGRLEGRNDMSSFVQLPVTLIEGETTGACPAAKVLR